MVVALLCVAQFVVVLDATTVAIALPAIQTDFELSTTVLGWVITAYTLTFGGCLLAAGRLADRVGRRRAPVAAARTATLGGGDAGEVAGYELGFALSAALAVTAALAVGAHARRVAVRVRRADATPRGRFAGVLPGGRRTPLEERPDCR
jgi:MFS family permease